MRKILFLLFVLFSICLPSMAKDHVDNLLSLLSMSRETVTKEKITSLLGEPASIEESNKRIWWHYTNENSNLVICWNKKSDLFENFSFKNQQNEKTVCDGQLCNKLKSGVTGVTDVVKLLGTPANMKINGTTQQLYYAYQNVKMRLFFRNRILVDFTLLTQINN